ncbi:hypothetical protein BDZ94DRAFT_1257363 [Collybia nuda]|uniref:DUF6593 domain-containing protein n=1 Tax=Collybia nuda TaxID=64659 RepID=A0A9P5Y913_9AGAR|nr:hypothetical protein BDZ94DRAFT_1257363 [Collybia nuda]
MSSLTFSHIDIINTTLVPSSQQPDSSSVTYRTKSIIGFRGRKTTTLSVVDGESEKVVGGIDWRDKSFVINGKEWQLSVLKSKPTGLYKTSLRIWDWGGQSYKIRLGNKQWTATSTTRLTPVVTFNQYQSNIFKANQPASIHFAPGMPEIDKIFFIFVMLYSEIRMQDESADGHLNPDC